jgi:hypothetical protein
VIELSTSETRDLFNDIGEMRQQIINIEKTLDKLVEEVARKRHVDWKGLITAVGVLIGVTITLVGGVGTLAVEHVVSTALEKNNQTVEEKIKLAREQAEDRAKDLVNQLVHNENVINQSKKVTR